MRARFQQIRQYLRGSLWFTPSLLVMLAIALALVMVALDRAVGVQVAVELPLAFDAGPDGAREVLSTIAGSVLTVAGVAFSITVLVFSFASAQYSSRTLRNFMEDRTHKLVLGTLLATFVYCLLVLRTIHSDGPDYVATTFVPVLSVTVALLLALLDLGLFTFLIHHIAASFQVSGVIGRVADETSKAIDRLYPDQLGADAPPDPAAPVELVLQGGAPVESTRAGYLQSIDPDGLLKLAAQRDLRVALEKRIGSYVAPGESLALVAPAERATDEVCQAIRAIFTFGAVRTVNQDAEFGFVQLTDIAAKALSPGVNDPTTALMCLDQIGRLLRQLATRRFPAQVRLDEQGAPRIAAPRPGFAELAAQCFDPLRRYGAGDAGIGVRMLEVLAGLALAIEAVERRDVLAEHARALIADCRTQLKSERDLRLLAAAATRIQAALPEYQWSLFG